MFSKLLIAVLLLFGTAVAQDEAPYKFYIGGEYVADKNFVHHNGAISIGTEFDIGDGLWIQTAWNKINVAGDGDMQSILTAAKKTIYAGKGYFFYVVMGAATNISDSPYQGTDAYGGFGMSKTLWTFEKTSFIPGQIDIYLDFSVRDIELLDNLFRANVGFSIALPVK